MNYDCEELVKLIKQELSFALILTISRKIQQMLMDFKQFEKISTPHSYD